MNRIKDLRVAADMSQAQLGRAIGCVGQTISKMETETRQLDPATIHALCDLFDCSADYLPRACFILDATSETGQQQGRAAPVS